MVNDVLRTVLSVTIIMVILGSVLAGGVFDTTISTERDTVEMTGGAGTFDTTFLGDVSNISAESTLGDAVALTGAPDSEIAASMDVTLGDSWSACTYSQADPVVEGNGSTRSLLSADTDRYDIALVYNDSTGEYQGWFYDAAARSTHAASVAAPDPTNQTLVCAINNESAQTFQVARNTTRGAATDTSQQDFADRPNAENWHGVLEETRLYPSALTDSQLSRWTTHPVLSVEGTRPAARLMYDTRDRSTSTVPVYFGSGSAGLSNASLVDGATGPELVQGEDWDRGGLLSWYSSDEIYAVDGGVLTGDGDVLFLTYDIDESAIELVQLGFALFVFLILAASIQRKLP